MKKYLDYIPKILQQDFIDNRVVPFIGAGFSKNAVVPDGIDVLDWEELGKAVAKYIPDYNYINAIEALSSFEAQFSRTKLVEIVAKELHIHSMKPGGAHKALCALNFEEICTTNFDFLIEKTLTETSMPFSTIVSEERLPISFQEETKVIKVHGDFNNPEHMVITEDDYDLFLERNKVLSTYISNIFITKTPFLVGYSLDDYDIRTLWKIVRSRLGRLHNPAYVVLIAADPVEVSKFERRDIKVINIPGKKTDYGKILENLFKEIQSLIEESASKKMVLTSDNASAESKMPKEERQLCFISALYNRISRLKDMLEPILFEKGIAFVSLDEAIMPGESIIRKADSLITQSTLAIVDITSNSSFITWEYENLIAKEKKVILIREKTDESDIPLRFLNQTILEYSFTEDNKSFTEALEKEISMTRHSLGDKCEQEYNRLLKKGEYKAAIISAFRYLEVTLVKNAKRHKSLFMLVNSLDSTNPVDRDNIAQLRYFLRIRNSIVHTESIEVDKKDADKIIKIVEKTCQAFNEGRVVLN